VMHDYVISILSIPNDISCICAAWGEGMGRSPGRRSLKKYVLAFHKKIEATKTAIFTVAAVLSRQDGMNRHSTSTNQSITMYQETVVTSLNDVFALSVQFPTSKTNKMGNLLHLFSLNKFMLQSLHVPSLASMACLFSK
jgi:hypothetical protein